MCLVTPASWGYLLLGFERKKERKNNLLSNSECYRVS